MVTVSLTRKGVKNIADFIKDSPTADLKMSLQMTQ